MIGRAGALTSTGRELSSFDRVRAGRARSSRSSTGLIERELSAFDRAGVVATSRARSGFRGHKELDRKGNGQGSQRFFGSSPSISMISTGSFHLQPERQAVVGEFLTAKVRGQWSQGKKNSFAFLGVWSKPTSFFIFQNSCLSFSKTAVCHFP